MRELVFSLYYTFPAFARWAVPGKNTAAAPASEADTVEPEKAVEDPATHTMPADPSGGTPRKETIKRLDVVEGSGQR